MIAELTKSALRNTYTQNIKIKTEQHYVESKNLFSSWKCIIFCNNRIRAKNCWQSIFFKTTNKVRGGMVRGRQLNSLLELGEGVWTSYEIFKKESLDRTSIFRGVWPYSGGCNFYIKIKLKSEIFNGKKNYKQKCFSLS